jgi:hypothetical protein
MPLEFAIKILINALLKHLLRVENALTQFKNIEDDLLIRSIVFPAFNSCTRSKIEAQPLF